MSATKERTMGRDMGLVGRLVRLLAGVLPLPLVIRSLLTVPASERLIFTASLLAKAPPPSLSSRNPRL